MIIIVNNYINDNLTIAHLRLPLSCILNPHVGLARVDYVLIKRSPKIVQTQSRLVRRSAVKGKVNFGSIFVCTWSQYVRMHSRYEGWKV